MQKNTTIALLLCAGVIYAVSLYGKTTAAKNLKVLFQGLKFEKSGSGNLLPALLLSFKIINPSSNTLQINSIVGDIFLNDSLLSTVEQTNPINIPANNISIYTIKLQTGITNVLQSFLSLIRKKQKAVIRFEGVANSSGFMIPIKQTIISI